MHPVLQRYPDAVPQRWSGTGRLLADHAYGYFHHCHLLSIMALKLGMKREHMLQQKWKRRDWRISRQILRLNQVSADVETGRRSSFFLIVVRKSHLGKLRVTYISSGNFSYHPKTGAVRKYHNIKNLDRSASLFPRFVIQPVNTISPTLITTI